MSSCPDCQLLRSVCRCGQTRGMCDHCGEITWQWPINPHLGICDACARRIMPKPLGFEGGIYRCKWSKRMNSTIVSLSPEANENLSQLIAYILESAETECVCRDDGDFEDDVPNLSVPLTDRCAQCLALQVADALD